MRSATKALLSATLALALATPALAQAEPVWPVRHKLLGKQDKNGDRKKSTDISGIACATDAGFPRTCMVIDDNLAAAQLVIVTDGELVAGSPVPLIADSDKGEALDLDGEGVAFADGSFYVLGSHGRPRRTKDKLDSDELAAVTARTLSSSQIVRVTLDPKAVDAEGRLTGEPTVVSSRKLRDLLRADPLIGPFVDRNLEENGLTIEGIAVRKGRVYVGLRGPSLGAGDGVIVSVAEAFLFGDAPATLERHLLPLGPGQGIRDLAVSGGDLLVLSGPTGEGDGPY